MFDICQFTDIFSLFQKNRKKTKKDATDAIHAKLLSFRSLNSNNTCDASISVTDDEDIVQRLQRENEELKSALKAERNNSPGVVRDNTDILQEYLQKIETKIEEMQENFQKKLDHAGKVNLEKFAELERNITNVGDSISKFPQPYPYVQHWLNSLPENENIED